MSGGNPWYDDDYTSPSSNGLSSSPDSIQQQINIDQKNRDRKANKRNIKDNQNNNTIKENNNETTSINNNHVTKDENIHAKVNGSNNHTIDEVDIHAIKETTDIHTNDEVTIKILAKRYEDLYRVAQETTLESLETNPALEKIDDLKTKLLFSIIVLAFRVTFRHRVELWTRVRVMLQVNILGRFKRSLLVVRSSVRSKSCLQTCHANITLARFLHLIANKDVSYDQTS